MRVPVPLPFRDRVEAYGDVTLKQIHEALAGSESREIPLSIVTSTQHTVGSKRLAQYASGEAKPNGPPAYIVHDGSIYLHNGHHRATHAVQTGKRTLRGNTGVIGPRPPRMFGKPGDLLLMSEKATAVEYREHDVQDVAILVGDVAVIEIETPLESKPSAGWWGYFDDYESILCRYENAMRDHDVRSVLLKIDSPGGAAAGLNACVDRMLKIKKQVGKPVITYIDEGAYSAAYAIACVGDRIYMPRAGGAGSIGVISRIVDWTAANKREGIRVETITSGKRKADGDPNVPVTKEAIAHVQRRVDSLARLYFKLVKETRGVNAKPLEADTFYGKDAIRAGLVDELMPLDKLIRKMTTDLDSVSGIRTDSRRNGKGDPLMSIQALAAAYETALKSGNKAKIRAARSALDKALTKSGGATASKKIVTTETKSTESSESEESSEEEEEEEEESHESESGMSLPSASASSGSSASSASSESEEEEEEEEENAATALAQLRSMTGQKTTRAALGMVAGAIEGHKRINTRLQKLEKDRAISKIDKLIAKGIASRQITPGNEKSLREMAAKHGRSYLKAYLKSAPAAVADEYREPRDGTDQKPKAVKIDSNMRKIWAKQGLSEEEMQKAAQALAERNQFVAKTTGKVN